MCSKKPHGLSRKLQTVQSKINQFHSPLDSNTMFVRNPSISRDTEPTEKTEYKDEFGTSIAYLGRAKTGLILQQESNKKGEKWLNRVFACGNMPINSQNSIEFYQGVKGSHSFKGLVACGKWWLCPVCSAKKAFKDHERLTGAIERFNKDGKHTYLFITNTAPHTFEDSINKTAKSINQGISAINKDKRYGTLKKDLGYVGTFRANEITMQYPNIKNGFHYHTHQLFVFRGDMSDSNFKTFKSLYIAKYKTKVNHPNLQIDVTRATGVEEVAAYISKEMNFSFTKDSNIFNVITRLKPEHHYIVERLQNETKNLKKTYTRGLNINLADETDLKDDEVLNLIAAIDPRLWSLILRYDLKEKLANKLIHNETHVVYRWLKKELLKYKTEVLYTGDLFYLNKKSALLQDRTSNELIFRNAANISIESHRNLRELKALGAKKRTIKQHKLSIFGTYETNISRHNNIGIIRPAD